MECGTSQRRFYKNEKFGVIVVGGKRISEEDWPDTKVCRKCLASKLLTDFSLAPKGVFGRNTWCKACMSSYHKAKNPRKTQPKLPPENWPDAKTCNGCGETKALECFSLQKRGLYDRMSKCKDCKAKDYKSWADANLVKRQEKQKRFIEANPNYGKDWYKKNPAKALAKIHKRRALVGDSIENYTAQEWLELCELYGHICLCCGRNDVPMTVDHVIPLSKGGSNGIHNIQPLCGSCNSKKGIKIIDYRQQVK